MRQEISSAACRVVHSLEYRRVDHISSIGSRQNHQRSFPASTYIIASLDARMNRQEAAHMSMNSDPRLQLQREGVVLECLGLHGILTEAIQFGIARNALGSRIVKFWKGEASDA